MPFLQSVTKHADKLKQTGESKIISKEGGLLLKDNLEGGATWAYEVGSQSMVRPIIVEDLPPWAYEVGSQSMVCPIIVEDLKQPRQMLVEMLCEERGLFLEIADIIRGLGLTILMGVMENKERQNMGTIYCRGNQSRFGCNLLLVLSQFFLGCLSFSMTYNLLFKNR
ncbi:transcription factor LHW-like [Solanum stenotomum]|uniref:transcription factor LHW-like n=1 Tax=Solanum stenotomum TaxID=172797 RepID=UPI0020D08592|nr:transcription factor LHW-like [Solanum stenotomum]